MTLTIDVLNKYKGLSSADWETKIVSRGIDHKRDKRLVEASLCYERKVPLFRSRVLSYIEPSDKQIADALIMQATLIVEYEELQVQRRTADEIDRTLIDAHLGNVMQCQDELNKVIGAKDNHNRDIEKLARLEEKYACVLKEQAWREAKFVSRTYHDTVYYIDLTAGNDGNTGLDFTVPWLTLEKYTTTTVRTAGDIAKVRANTIEIPAGNIVFDEDGTTAGGYIEIRGASVADDPWGDASDVKPIIDFNSTTNSLSLNGDDYWLLYRLDVKNSAASGGMIKVQYNSGECVLDTLDISGASHASSAFGVQIEGQARIINSNFSGNNHRHIYSTRYTIVRNCVFNGGVATTDYGILTAGGYLVVSNSTFGSTTAHDTASISATQGSVVVAYNNLFSDATEFIANGNSLIYSEDHDQVLGAHKMVTGSGTVSRDSAIQLDGYDSILMTPSSSCSSILPLTISSREYIRDYQIWVPAALTTITITARETAAWAADPTNAQFYFEASYISTASGSPTRSTVVSTETLSGVTEVDFTLTFTPAREGFVYIAAYLKNYEAGKSLQVSTAYTRTGQGGAMMPKYEWMSGSPIIATEDDGQWAASLTASIADAVWDEAASGHKTAGTFGTLQAMIGDWEMTGNQLILKALDGTTLKTYNLTRDGDPTEFNPDKREAV